MNSNSTTTSFVGRVLFKRGYFTVISFNLEMERCGDNISHQKTQMRSV